MTSLTLFVDGRGLIVLYGYFLDLISYPRFTFQRPEFYLMADLSQQLLTRYFSFSVRCRFADEVISKFNDFIFHDFLQKSVLRPMYPLQKQYIFILSLTRKELMQIGKIFEGDCVSVNFWIHLQVYLLPTAPGQQGSIGRVSLPETSWLDTKSRGRLDSKIENQSLFQLQCWGRYQRSVVDYCYQFEQNNFRSVLQIAAGVRFLFVY